MSELDSPDDGIKALERLLEAVPGGLGLGPLLALVSVGTTPGISVNELAERIDVPQQTASRYVAQLMGRYQEIVDNILPAPFLEQRVSTNDPRKRALYLTDQGRKTISDMLAAGWKQ